MKLYSAVAYHPSLPAGRANGHLEAEIDGLRFVGGDGMTSVMVPYEGMEMRMVGMNEDLPDFRHPTLPDWVILCQDREIALNEHVAAQRDLHARLAKAAVRHRSVGKPMKVLGLLVGLMVFGVVMLWAARHAIVRGLVQQIPLSWEQKLGDVAWEQVKAQEVMVEDPELIRKLSQVTAKLVKTGESGGYEFRFHIAKNDVLMNAYALPGGNIVVYTGLMKKVKREEQLAGVLAHEMAHVLRRHSLQNLVSKVGLWVVISTVVGDGGALAAILAESSQMVLGQKFSRDVERDADEVAWQILMEAGVDPRGLREFFELLLAEERAMMGGLGAGALNWLSTHPSTEERIERLREKEALLP